MAYPIQTLPDYTTLDAASYKAAIDSIAANFARRAGGFSVEAQTIPTMSVRVAAGSSFDGSALSDLSAQTVSITTAPTLPNNRIDRIVFNVTTGLVQLATGTATTTPTAPGVPAGCFPLARVTINGGTTAITNSMIVDERPAFQQSKSGLVLLNTVTASSSATLDLTSSITGTYDSYVIELQDLIPATSGADLWLRTSANNGSSFDTTGYDYAARATQSGSSLVAAVVGSNLGQVVLAQNCGNGTAHATSGTVRMFNPLGTAVSKKMCYEMSGEESSAGELRSLHGDGRKRTAAIVNAVRVMFSSGSISSGTIRIYGVTKV